MSELLTSIFNFAKSGSLKGAVNTKDLGKALRTAGIVAALAGIGSLITDAGTLDYGAMEVAIVAGLTFVADAVRRRFKDNS